MKIIKTMEIPEIPNPHSVSVRALLANDQAQFEYIQLQPGEALKMHVTYTQVYLYVLDGQGIVQAGGEEGEIAADMLVEIPPEIPHRLVQCGPGMLRLLNVKAPRALKATHLVAAEETQK